MTTPSPSARVSDTVTPGAPTADFDPLVPRPIDLPTPVPLDQDVSSGNAAEVLDDAKIFVAPEDPADRPRWREQLATWRTGARQRYGFDGLVCTDFGLINDGLILGEAFPARAWGVEHLTPRERVKKVLDAGADQFGGEACPELVLDLVSADEVTEERLDMSVRRILREKFDMGLFEDPFVDPDAAAAIVGSP